MSDWFVYDDDGVHRGPLSTAALARAIRAKRIAADVWVAVDPSTDEWQKACDVPVIMQTIAALASGELRVVAGAFTANWEGSPEFGSTVMMAPRTTKR